MFFSRCKTRTRRSCRRRGDEADALGHERVDLPPQDGLVTNAAVARPLDAAVALDHGRVAEKAESLLVAARRHRVFDAGRELGDEGRGNTLYPFRSNLTGCDGG